MGPGRAHSSFSIESIGCQDPGPLGLKEARTPERLFLSNQFKGRCDLQQSVALKGDGKHCASGGPGRGNATAILLASGPEGVGHEQQAQGQASNSGPPPKPLHSTSTRLRQHRPVAKTKTLGEQSPSSWWAEQCAAQWTPPGLSGMARYPVRTTLGCMRQDAPGHCEFATQDWEGSGVAHVTRRWARAAGGMGDAGRLDLQPAAPASPPCLLRQENCVHVISNGYALAVTGLCGISQALGRLSFHCRSSQVLAG